MSIELENPKSPLAKIDAAANFVQQMFLSHQIGDNRTFEKAHKKAGDLLFKAQRQLEQHGEGNIESDIDSGNLTSNLKESMEWINVKDQVPVQFRWVLVWIEDRKMAFMAHRRGDNGLWESYFPEVELYANTIEFWQPMPVPPKIKASEGVE